MSKGPGAPGEKDALTDVPGFQVGHAQNLEAGTGCTVVICSPGAITAAEVRGGAPGTREGAVLNTVNLVDTAHAVYLGGGSSFGLDGASGVMKYLEERGIGFEVGVTKVPIVPGAILFDLHVGSPALRPDAEMGYQACLQASETESRQGNVGAGTGATVGKVAGISRAMKGGIGTASFRSGSLVVGGLVALNCFGDCLDPQSGRILAGTLTPDRSGLADSMKLLTANPEGVVAFSSNTTLGIIATNAKLTKSAATRVAMMSHDGYARAINPVHTMFDGDITFCMAHGEVKADTSILGAIAAQVMTRAIVKAVTQTPSLYGIPSYRDLRRRVPPGLPENSYTQGSPARL